MHDLRSFAENEYVDTSDPEEREDMATVGLPRQVTTPSRKGRSHELYTSRKRMKLDHNSSSPASTRLSQNSVQGSLSYLSELYASSPQTGPNISFSRSSSPQADLYTPSLHGTPTVHAVTDEEFLYTGDEGGEEVYTQTADQEAGELGKSSMEGSQDPLNLLSEVNLVASPSKELPDILSVPVPSSPSRNSPTLQLIAHTSPHATGISDVNHHWQPMKSRGSTPQDPLSDNSYMLGLFTPLSSRIRDPVTPASTSRTFHNTGGNSQHSLERTQMPRFSSSPLSPLSPLSSPITFDAQARLPLYHAHTLSPTPSSMSQHSRPSPPIPVLPSKTHADGSEDDGSNWQDQPKRYSLRTRKARQLNPYEFEKRQYKQQMRNNPEAIVKIISPRKRNHEHERERPRRHGESQEEEWVMGDGNMDDESQTQTYTGGRKSKERGDTGDNERGDATNESKKWYPKEFDLSDDDLPALPPLTKPENYLKRHENDKLSKKKKKTRFPLPNPHSHAWSPNGRESISGDPGPSTIANRRLSMSPSPLRSPSHKPAAEAPRQNRFNMSTVASSDSRGSSPPSPRNRDLEYGRLMDDDPLDLGADPYGGPGSPHAVSSPQHQIDEVISIPSDHDMSRNSSGEETDPESFSQSSDSRASERRREEERRKRKALKALGRMMPAVMISKVIHGQATTKQSAHPRSESASDDDGEPIVAPGHSRRKRPSGFSRDFVDIRGDTESSEPKDAHSDTPDILSSEGEHSEGADLDGKEAVEVSWHDHDFSHQYRAPGVFRDTEDLIDRMLSRTAIGTGIRKPRAYRSSSSSKASKSDNFPRPKNPSLDIIVGSSRKQGVGRQTALTFPRVSNRDNKYGRPNSMDQTSRKNGTVHTVSTVTCNIISRPNQHPIQTSKYLTKAKSKKRMREELARKQTFLVPSDGKVIKSGLRRKIVNIDIDDDGFHEALAPLQHNMNGDSERLRLKPDTKSGPKYGHSASKSAHHDLGVFSEKHQDWEFSDDHDGQVSENLSHSSPNLKIRDSWDGNGLQKKMAKLTMDLDIPFLSSGLAFGANTYLGRQLLHDLLAFVSGANEITCPCAYAGFDFSLDPKIGAAAFIEVLERVSQILREWLLSESFNPDDSVESQRYEDLMQCVCYFSVWLVSQGDGEAQAGLRTAVSDVLRGLTNSIRIHLDVMPLVAHTIDVRVLSIQWFAVELSSRMLSLSRRLALVAHEEEWNDYVLLLMRYLIIYGLRRTMDPILLETEGLNEPSTALRAAELWICLIHLVPQVRMAPETSGLYTPALREPHPFWKLVLRMFAEDRPKHLSNFEASEHIWRVIFSLTALSQFSSHGNSTPNPRLPACWDLVSSALKVIRLTADPEVDRNLSRISLRKRDEYVRLVAARCNLLKSRWQWLLDEAFTMLYCLVEIFKSRNFGNLRGEGADFPAFLRHSNLQLLTGIRGSDTVFSLYLKLVVQAARDTQAAQISEQRAATKKLKLLSLTVPLSSVTFTKSMPPVGQELSMLYNRFSSIIVAIYLDPTETNLINRLAHARRYVAFQDADWKSKQACVRALMHAAILVRHLSLPLDASLKWLEEMTEILVNDYLHAENPPKSTELPTQRSVHPAEERNQAIVSIQLLLGCVRRIIERSSMDPSIPAEPKYPDPALLDGSWVTRVFATRGLTNIVTTRKEILKLVQTFLDVRMKVMPTPRRPALAPVSNQETGESQDEFGQFDLDWDDPELIAVLEKDSNVTPLDENKMKDERVAKIMDVHISPAIYRLVIQHFSDPSVNCPVQDRIEDYCYDADKWVDCWVGCAAVIVQNGRRDWSHYLSLGPQSWERISDSSLRRRVGLRFMFKLLLLDPTAYLTHQDSFLELLLESMVTAKITLENEYMSLLLSVDGMRHPMLRDLPVERTSETEDFHITRSQFADMRIAVMDAIFVKVSNGLDRAAQGEDMLEYTNQKWIGFVLTMLSTLREIFDSFGGKQWSYVTFSRAVFSLLSRHPTLQMQPRIAGLVVWGAGLEVINQ